LIITDTFTTGDDCAVVGFVKVKVTTHGVPDTVPPAAAVNTSCPDVRFHAPVVPNRSPVDITVKFALLPVCDPVRPVMVTVDPAARLKLAVSETVNVFAAFATGVLCWIDFRLKPGTSTVSGSAPLTNPYNIDLGFVIAADAIEPMLLPSASLIIADTLTAGEIWAVDGFVKVKFTTVAVPDTVPAAAAVNTSCPDDCVHAPVVPNRPDVDVTVKIPSTVWDPVRPVMVTVDPVARL
jgi:hypothetical protein